MGGTRKKGKEEKEREEEGVKEKQRRKSRGTKEGCRREGADGR